MTAPTMVVIRHPYLLHIADAKGPLPNVNPVSIDIMIAATVLFELNSWIGEIFVRENKNKNYRFQRLDEDSKRVYESVGENVDEERANYDHPAPTSIGRHGH